MVSSHYGKEFNLQYLRDNCFITREGVSLLGISEAAKKIGFNTFSVKLKTSDLKKDYMPCILHWNQNHFVVLYKITKNIFTGKLRYKIADPAHGFITLSEEKFKKYWLSDEEKGVALFLEPTEYFFGQEPPKEEKTSIKNELNKAVEIANIRNFIEEMPLGLKTKIGASGNGLSGGQKQRILIARTVYKKNHYIFFDEATSALDTENERKIHENLQLFFKGKTVLVVAHRLSTVKNTDNIVVLKKGEINRTRNLQRTSGKKRRIL